MTEEFIPTLTHATERDIDLLLVEELFSSPAFVSWMAERGGIVETIKSSTVLHSKRRTRNRREIDILCEMEMTDGSTAAMLIENKLDALEQADQAESYREELAVLADRYTYGIMLIACPKIYQSQHIEFTDKFDAVVSYEDLVGYFAKRANNKGSLSLRYQFRRELLEQAINKSRRGYTPVPNKIIGDFNALYCDLLAATAPAIVPGPSMRKNANPDESVSMIFDAAASLEALPDEIRPRRFAHELGKGQPSRANYVAVTFARWGPALARLREMFESDAMALGAEFSSKVPSKRTPKPGLVMSCSTLPANNQLDFSSQTDILRAGMLEAANLRRWLLDNQDILMKWKMAVDKEFAV